MKNLLNKHGICTIIVIVFIVSAVVWVNTREPKKVVIMASQPVATSTPNRMNVDSIQQNRQEAWVGGKLVATTTENIEYKPVQKGKQKIETTERLVNGVSDGKIYRIYIPLNKDDQEDCEDKYYRKSEVCVTGLKLGYTFKESDARDMVDLLTTALEQKLHE